MKQKKRDKKHQKNRQARKKLERLELPEPAARTGELLPRDDNLLECARTQWQFGDWDSLAKLERDSLQHHPDRAQLALLAAAGRLQTGQLDEARAYIRLAQDWGVSNRLVSQMLVAGVHNSLGRAAAIAGQQTRALKHFESSIFVGAPSSPINLLANIRIQKEIKEFCQLTDSQELPGQPHPRDEMDKGLQDSPRVPSITQCITDTAHIFYAQLLQKPKQVPFLLIDAKSLPRSGLHYLKNILGKLFGEHFSFCEWYQEPGCCKQMPCALTGFADHAEKTGDLRIRLTKSHDFELSDPIYETNRYLRRLVLVRDPLYILTSWFTLDQLNSHQALLAAKGINIKKIWLSHEKEVLAPAYQLLSDHFTPPPLGKLMDWLDKQSNYIKTFTAKWAKPKEKQPDPFSQVVRYEEINHYIADLVSEYGSYLPTETLTTLNQAIERIEQKFNQRENPCIVPAERVSEYIRNHVELFQAAAIKAL